MYLMPQELKTYANVLSVARKVERGFEKTQGDQMRQQVMKRPFVPMGRGVPFRVAKMQRQPYRPAPYQSAQPLPVCSFCGKLGHIRPNCRRANGLCLWCGSRDHAVETCPHRRIGTTNQTLPALPGPSGQRVVPGPLGQRSQGPAVRRDQGPVVRRPPLPPQHMIRPVQRGGRTAAGRGRGQAYNLTEAEAEASEEVITGNIRVHSKPVLALFDSGASHCYISDNFVAVHSIPVKVLDHKWEISTGNGVVLSSRVCTCLLYTSPSPRDS